MTLSMHRLNFGPPLFGWPSLSLTFAFSSSPFDFIGAEIIQEFSCLLEVSLPVRGSWNLQEIELSIDQAMTLS